MNRSTLILIAILIALGAIVIFLLPGEKEHEISYTQDVGSIAIDSASVVKLDMRKAGKSITLENIGGRWTLTSPLHFAADITPINQLLSALARFTVGSLISTNPEKQSLFQVDSSGTLLTVTDRSGKSTALIVGKMGPSFSEVYFRLPSSKEVYLAEGFDGWLVSKDVKEWRDKTILGVTSEGIANLTYQMGDRQYKFLRDSAGWKLDGRQLDRSSMSSTLTSLANFKADDFVDSAFTPPSRPISLEIHGVQNMALQFYPVLPDSSKYYVQLQGNPTTYVLGKWTAQQILQPVLGPPSSPKASVAEAQKPRPQPAVTAKQPAAPPVAVREQPKKESPPEKKAQPAVTPAKTPSKAESKPAPVVTRKEQPHQAPPATKPAAKAGTSVTAKEKPTQAAPEKSAEPAPQTSAATAAPAKQSTGSIEDEGDLTVYTVQRGETMTSIARKYNVTVEQILKWNLLKSISIKPGQELYIYVRKK